MRKNFGFERSRTIPKTEAKLVIPEIAFFDPSSATVESCNIEIDRLEAMLSRSQRSSDGDAGWIREEIKNVQELKAQLTQ